MVRALHAAGLEVLLDVVYNHTGEGNEHGPTLCHRGLDNPGYYRLVPGDPAHYFDTTGTGNSLDLSHPGCLRMVLDSLRYWATVMHVDGFRFDLAATLAREEGRFDRLSSFFDVVTQDPVVSQVKLIAEPWDVGQPDSYDVGRFPPEWSEWNGKFRDTVRDFWRSQDGQLGQVATRVGGSPDLYGWSRRRPAASINFITSHDGFTLRDLVSYDTKHNQANGEANRDGTDDNRSWNCGVEGPSDDPAIVALRARQSRVLLATLALSRGVPMLCGGDELGRTQGGNNNAYCQDNPISWYDWSAVDHDLVAFTRRLLAVAPRPPGAAPPQLRHRPRSGLVHPGRHAHDRGGLAVARRQDRRGPPGRDGRTRPGPTRAAAAGRRPAHPRQRLVGAGRLHASPMSATLRTGRSSWTPTTRSGPPRSAAATR